MRHGSRCQNRHRLGYRLCFHRPSLSLIKSLSDHNVRSFRPRRSAMLRNLSVVGVWSPRSSRSRATILTGDADMALPHAMSGEERISPKRPRNRLSLWLRPRDVRTDDAVHRPREMSCQLKAVGSRGGPDNLCLMTDAFYFCDNSENSRPKRDGGASSLKMIT
jgi:hypothetical protein